MEGSKAGNMGERVVKESEEAELSAKGIKRKKEELSIDESSSYQLSSVTSMNSMAGADDDGLRKLYTVERFAVITPSLLGSHAHWP